MSSEILGICLAICALFLNGTWMIFGNFPSVKKTKINPIIFTLYILLGAIVYSIIVYIVLQILHIQFTITYLGFVAGLLFALSIIFLQYGIKYIGISYSVCFLSCTSLLTSFIQSLIIEEYPSDMTISIVGILAILLGFISISLSATCSKRINYKPMVLNEDDSNRLESIDENEPLLVINTTKEKIIFENSIIFDVTTKYTWKGIFFGSMAGILGGSVPLPEYFTSEFNSNLKFIPSFALGLLCSLIATFWLYTMQHLENINWKNFHFTKTVTFGMISGSCWMGGYTCLLYAIGRCGYVFTVPVYQSAVVISTMWGIFLFKEIKQTKTAIALIASCFIVISGIVLLGVGA